MIKVIKRITKGSQGIHRDMIGYHRACKEIQQDLKDSDMTIDTIEDNLVTLEELPEELSSILITKLKQEGHIDD